MHGNCGDYLWRCWKTLLTKYTRSGDNHADRIRQTKGESVSSKTYYEKNKHAIKIKQRYVDHPRDQSELTSLIHSTRDSSD